MRNINIIFFLGLLTVACKTEIPVNEPVSETAPLSTEQISLAGVELDQLRQQLVQEKISCTGIIDLPPQSIHYVHPPHMGFVGGVPQIIGDYVRKGQVLTRISHPDLLSKQKDYLESEIALIAAEKDFQRKQGLQANKATSELAFEKAENIYQQALVHRNALKAEMKSIGIKVDALLESKELQNSIAILAPRSGYIDAIHTRPGKLCLTTEALYQIVDLNHMHLELNVLAKDISKIKTDQKVELQTAGHSETIAAEIHRLAPGIDPDTKTAQVHAHIVQPDKGKSPKLLPGAFINAQIIIEERNAWVLPEGGVLRTGTEAFVFAKTLELYEKIKVNTGFIGDGIVEILNSEALQGKSLVSKGAYYINASLTEEEE